jgi:hypothetical protein
VGKRPTKRADKENMPPNSNRNNNSSSLDDSKGNNSTVESGIVMTRSVDDSDSSATSGFDSTSASDASEIRTMPMRISGRSAFIGGTPISGIPKKNQKDLELGNDNDSDYRRTQQPNTILAKRSKKNDDASHASSSSTAHESLWTSYERPKKLWIGLCCVAIILIATIIAVSVIVARKEKENQGSEMTAQQQEISDIIYSVSDPHALATSDSPQAQAHQWIVFDDNLYSKADSEEFDRDDVVQRYVLGVFYFATNGASTWKNNSWLIEHECKNPWTNVYCNDDNRVRAISFGKYSSNSWSHASNHLVYGSLNTVSLVILDTYGLHGMIPSEIGHLSNMENLIIKNEKELSGSIPSSFGKMSGLRQLGLNHNSLVGSIPPQLFVLTDLRYLNLEGNMITGTIASEIKGLQSLETLSLSNNMMHGSIPFESIALTQVQYLGFSANKFSGTIGNAIRDCKALQYLYLDRNELSGPLTSSIGGAESLRSINLDLNALTGNLPAILGRLKKLEYLSMQSNKIQGSIPAEITLLTTLKTLNLVSNELTGVLPDLSPMKKLQFLMLVGNKLKGTISDNFSRLTNLGTSYKYLHRSFVYFAFGDFLI